MKKLGLIFFFTLVLGQISFSQVFRFYNDLDSLKTEVIFQTENFVQSNFLTQKITSDIIFSNYIPQEVMEKMQNKLGAKNLLNAETRQSLQFNYKVDSNWVIGLNVADRILGYGLFSKDFIEVLSSGNRSNQTEVYDFSGSNLNLFKFQEFGVNLKYKVNNMHQINFGINYLNLEAFNQVQLKNTTFSVNDLGTETEILLSGNAQFSDTTNKSLMANNGGGFSLSGAYTTHFSILKNQPRKGTATMFFKDLGKLYANNQTLTYEQNDEEYNFNGIYIENISNYKPKIFQEQSPDTIYQRIISSAKFEKASSALPWLVGFTVVQPIFAKSNFSFGSYFRNISGSLPLFYGSYETEINQNLRLEVNSNAGGFGNFSVGAGATGTFDKLRIKLKTANLNSLIFNQTQTGLGIFAEINYRIK